ncbi:hypothetical protein T4D_4948 [Trichinella pseudospiralis]|uniref:Uncharacterized protein n=1 Tax=Trichinella pseudospiralis TaxID=6337 RepID=A0A0V1FED7_TRIPS|nr:hypothetical protein T4D_4948 [Trichinella pseudospiralis]
MLLDLSAIAQLIAYKYKAEQSRDDRMIMIFKKHSVDLKQIAHHVHQLTSPLKRRSRKDNTYWRLCCDY